MNRKKKTKKVVRNSVISAIAWMRYFVAGIVLLTVFTQNIPAQSTLTEKLEEDDSFYKNYGKEPYSKIKIEQDVIGLYDLFGDYITDGKHIYELSNSAVILNSDRENINDSTLFSKSNEFQRSDMYEKFSNLVITQDAIGGVKTSFLIGDQIRTGFTPLTFNKTNFRGIRWDTWSTGLQLSLLLSRTRPGAVGMKGTELNSALVEYPATPETFPQYYYRGEVGQAVGGFAGTGDFSDRSPYGDFDWLWALHAQNTIANKVDVGVTYINHHVSDVKKGEKFFKGNIPDEWMPNEIHFEFTDLTPRDTLDAGAYVDNVRMKVNGRLVEPLPQYRGTFKQVYVGTRDSILMPSSLPLPRPVDGIHAAIVAFKTDPRFWRFSDNHRSLLQLSDVKEITFEYTVAGNYLVFVSTDRQIPLGILGEADPQTGKVTYEQITKPVEEIYEGENNKPLHIGAPRRDDYISGESVELYSATYFGEFLAKSPKLLSMDNQSFSTAVGKDRRNTTLYANSSSAQTTYNYNTYSYRYSLNVSSVTYGVNFRGELGGVTFSGEVALNQKEHMLPGRDDSRKKTNTIAGALKAERAVGSAIGLNGDFYYISPEWKTNLDNMQASRYFRETEYKSRRAYKDYNSFPQPFNNNWNNVDDNDDNDPFVESDYRRYPSDFNANDEKGKFWTDGTLKHEHAETLELPSGMEIPYDDPDGVVASKEDRNKNGTPDYWEDFLLFESDPPVFELGNDLNNNGLPDREDDDILPDFGHSVGYFVTSNGIHTQGIKGANLNVRWTVMDNLFMDFGTITEGIIDYDLTGRSDFLEEHVDTSRDFFSGKSFVGYWTTLYEVLRRSKGIHLEFGNELRAIRDALRNDAVSSNSLVQDGDLDVTYGYYIDPLEFRRSLVDNVIANITYTNIPNFEYGFNLKLGAQKRFEIHDHIYNTEYSIYDSVARKTIYLTKWAPYEDAIIGDVWFVNKLNYRIEPKVDFTDWLKPLNIFNRILITPQYKFSWFHQSVVSGRDNRNPRNIENHLRWDISGEDGVPDYSIDSLYDNEGDNLQKVADSRIDIQDFLRDNMNLIINVPAIRATYKIAENTEFQMGFQWLRYVDNFFPENNYLKQTVLGQIVARSNYSGYNVTFQLGARYYNYNYDITFRDPVALTGSRYDRNGYEFFARIFSGS